MTVTKIRVLRCLARRRRPPLISPPFFSGGLSTTTSTTSDNGRLCPTTESSPWFCHNPSRSFSLYVSAEDDRGELLEAPLASFNRVQLQYPFSRSSPLRLDLSIAHPSKGGHVLLGANGCGKSLISNALAEGFRKHRQAMRGGGGDSSSPFFQKGCLQLSDDQVWHAQAIAHVSFESHEELLAQTDDQGQPLSVQKAIASGGTLNKAAQFLVVRFGLFPLLTRSVSTLSTGEIRKVLLIKALANRPRLLVLDNAFDGLDVPSRSSLKDLVSKTLQGFRPDILVQAVDAKATAHTQVLLITHRAEEIVDPIAKVTYMPKYGIVVTEDRQERSGEALLQQALELQEEGSLLEQAWSNATLPSVKSIAAWWQNDSTAASDDQSAIVSLDNIQIQRGETILLDNLNWTVRPGQHWWIAGGNGAGKSTLSRLLARNEAGIVQGALTVNTTTTTEGQAGDRRRGVSWVSTESHMALARSELTTQQVLTQHPEQSSGDVTAVLEWLELPKTDDFLQRPFGQLSQGEQKLVLIAAAIASQPRLLVLDEPCQGLDWIKRQRVLGLVERLCQGSDLSLIYITHHPEEVIPSISHVLHLARGQDVFQGMRKDYDTDTVAVAAAAVEKDN